MRGSGKSTIGKLLARKLHRQYLETDHLLENQKRMKIKRIVKKYSWAYFRKLEEKVIKDISNTNNAVIGTGGGIVISDINVQNFKKNGFLIYLKASAYILINRIGNDENRPFLTYAQNVKEDIQKTLESRKDLYEKSADYIIEVDLKTPHDIVEEIIAIYYSLGKAKI